MNVLFWDFIKYRNERFGIVSWYLVCNNFINYPIMSSRREREIERDRQTEVESWDDKNIYKMV